MKTKRKRQYLQSDEDWTVIFCTDSPEVDQCISNKEVIWPILQRGVSRLISEERESLPVIEIRCLSASGSAWVTIRKSDCLSTLNKLLNWREKREEYEECAEILRLMKSYERMKTVGSVQKSALLNDSDVVIDK